MESNTKQGWWKRRLASPFAAGINWYHKHVLDEGLLLRLPGWRHNFPSWIEDVNPSKIIRTVHGFDIRCNVFDYVGEQIIRNKDWESLIGATIAACIPQGGVGVDVGANIGFHTMRMSRAAGPTGRVVAFEPVLSNFAVLIDTLQRNRVDNVMALNLALSDRDGVDRIVTDGPHSSLRQTVDGKSRQLTLVMRGGQLPIIGPEETIDLLKIDAEGLEKQVLEGISGLLGRVRHVICEISPDWADVEGIHSLMKAEGFHHVATPPEGSQLFQREKWISPENQAIPGYHDVLFYRDMTDSLAALVR